MSFQYRLLTHPGINRKLFCSSDPSAVNNNNNNLDDIYSAVIYGASHMREFTVVHLGQSRPEPGGRQLAGQAANLTFESACRLLEAEHSPIATGIITQP